MTLSVTPICDGLYTLDSLADPDSEMKAAVLVPALAVAALAGAIQGRDGHCGGDNCARQVTGTRPGLTPISSRRADCSNFMKTTVVPDATWVPVLQRASYKEPLAKSLLQRASYKEVPAVQRRD